MADVTSAQGAAQDLPDLSNKEMLKRFRGRLEGSKRWREQEGFDKTWTRLRDLYRLKCVPAGLEAEEQIVVAIAFATVNVISPSVSINHPNFSVNARSFEFGDQATIATSVLNYWWRHHDFQPEFRRAVKDFLVYGHGWLKVGWRYEEKEAQVGPEEQDQYLQEANQQVDQFAEQAPHLAQDLPTQEDVQQFGAPQTKTETVKDHPFVERVSPYDIFIDPEATCMEDLTWIAQRVVRVLEEVKKDTRYRRSTRRSLSSDGSTKWSADPRASKVYSEDDIQRVTIWEFYDIRRKQMCVFAESGDNFLIDPTEMPYPFGHPFVPLRDYDVPDQFYPIGELEAIEPLNLELNLARSQMANDRKAYKRKYLYRESALGEPGLDGLTSDEDNTLIPITDDTPFQDVIAPMPNAAPNPELYNYSEVIESDTDRVSGVNEYMRGALPEIRRTATEASIIQDAANARADDKLANVETVLRHVGDRLLQLAQLYMSGEQTARIVGHDGTQAWFKFTADDIQGEFDMDVEAGSTQPKNDTFRRQQAQQLMQSMAPFVGTVIDPAQLATYVLKEGFGIKNPEQFIMQDAPDQGPQEKLIETIAYKDTPPDIQRQMEQQAGFVPSALGDQERQTGPTDGSAPGGDQSSQKQSTEDPKQSQDPQDRQASSGVPDAIRTQLEGQTGLPQGAPQ